MRKLIIPIIFFTLCLSLSAQTLLHVANDPAIVTGKTNNGLTYYLVKDTRTGRGFADFYMVQKWGTSAEAASQTGFTSLLEGMNLIESRGFPDGSLFRELGSLGISPDRALICEVGTDDVIMGLRDVPVVNASALDVVLSALINMCSGAEVNENTIDSGLALQYHSTADIQSPALRERENLLRALFPSELRLSASAENEIGNAYEAGVQPVWEFQKQWCLPETQALVIVGDIDADAIKSKISLLSGMLPRGGRAEIPSFNPDLKPGQEVFHSYIDREADMAYLTVDFLQKPVAQSERGTHIAIVRSYISTVLRNLMEARINSLKENVPFPIYKSYVCLGDFCGLNGTDALSITLATTPDHIYDASEFMSSVVAGLRKGVTESEFKNAADLCQADFSEDSDFTCGVFRHYLEGFTHPSSEVRADYASKLRKTFGLSQMNAYLTSYLEKDTWKIIHCMSPDDVCDAGLKESFNRGKIKGLLPSENTPSISSQTWPAPVKVKAPVNEPITGSLTYTLPNYSKVYFRKCDSEPGKISLVAVSKGGLSLADKSPVFLSRYVDDLSELSLPAVPDSKQMTLRREFTPDRTYLKGDCRTEDLELFFQMISQSFTECRIDEKAFSRKLEELTLKDVLGYVSPEARFRAISSGCLEPEKDFSVLDWKTASDFLNKTCSNIGGWTFLIAGDCSESVIKDYIEKYLAPIQGRKASQSFPTGRFSAEPDGSSQLVEMPMEVPRYIYGINITGQFTYSLQGVLTTYMISTLIRQKVAENLFAEGIVVSSDENFISSPRNLLSISFKMTSPDELSYYEKILDGTLEDLKKNGVPDDRVEAVRQYIASSLVKKSSSGNNYWLEAMEARINGKDFISQRDATISALTCGEINNALKMFLSSASRTTSRVTPEILRIQELPPIEFEDVFPTPLDTTLDLSALLGRPIQDDAAAEDTSSDEESSEEDALNEEETEKNMAEQKDSVTVRQAVISDTSDM